MTQIIETEMWEREGLGRQKALLECDYLKNVVNQYEKYLENSR